MLPHLVLRFKFVQWLRVARNQILGILHFMQKYKVKRSLEILIKLSCKTLSLYECLAICFTHSCMFLKYLFVFNEIHCILLQSENFGEMRDRAKSKNRKARQQIEEQIDTLLEAQMEAVPRPRVSQLWPIILTVFTVMSIITAPQKLKKRMEEKEERRKREEEEARRILEEESNDKSMSLDVYFLFYAIYLIWYNYHSVSNRKKIKSRVVYKYRGYY